MGFYNDEQTQRVVDALRKAGWPKAGMMPCQNCGHRVVFKPGGLLGPGGDLYNVEPCDKCGKRPNAEIRRHHGVVADDDD